jgi:amidophosphoribosyltransferase
MSDKFKHECAVAAVFGNKNAAELCMQQLYMQQHRGPQATGMVTWDDGKLIVHKKTGEVRDVFTPNVLSQLPGRIAVGHNRYNTCGGDEEEAIQPHVVKCKKRGCEVVGASNGDVPCIDSLRSRLEEHFDLESSNDGEAIVTLVAYHLDEGLETLEAIRQVMTDPDLRGAAYSCVFIIEGEVWLFRDPLGFRPLSIGRYGKAYVAASETVAFDIIGADYIRDIKPGEIYCINEEGGQGFLGVKSDKTAFCIFEYIYFGRPDSKIFGHSVSEIRKRLGAKLWELYRYDIVPGLREIEAIVDTTERQEALRQKLSEYVVISVPDSSNSIALGVSRASGIEFDFGLIRGHYSKRTFLEKEQGLRKESVKYKHNPDRSVLAGKRVIVVDDSIVRSTTMEKDVRMIRNAGAIEVIVLVGSPPIISQCFFGIDTPTKGELAAANSSVDEICLAIESDKLFYLTLEGLLESVPDGGTSYCLGCFTGKYPYHERIPADKMEA